jgi:hypothetical protein
MRNALRGADPSGEGGTVKVDALASIDLRLPIQWLVITVM